MAISGKLYYTFLVHALTGAVDLDTDNIRVMMTTSGYTPNQTHEYLSDVSSEVSGTGYTAEGQTLASCSVYNDTSTVRFDAADSEWTGSTISARYAVIYSHSGAASTEYELIGYVDFDGTQSSSSGTFTIQWSAAGIATITVD